jgi:hypothetical protein
MYLSSLTLATMAVNDRSGSWPCKNFVPGEVGGKAEPVRSQAAIAAISGLVPTMFMTRVRL